jgi:hypothetical protein
MICSQSEEDMKRLLIAALSTLTVAVAVPAQAQGIVAMTQNIQQVTPFNLVKLGYQGYFRQQGISSNSAFVSAIRTGKIKAEDLVKSGIARGRLTPETLNNQSYLHHVRVQLESLKRSN